MGRKGMEQWIQEESQHLRDRVKTFKGVFSAVLGDWKHCSVVRIYASLLLELHSLSLVDGSWFKVNTDCYTIG